MNEFEEELKLGFLNESVDLLNDAEESFLNLESERDDIELINKIFRLAHNLKGASKAVGFHQLAELTHIAENLILKIKEGDLEVSDSIVSILLDFKDKAMEMVEELKSDFTKTFDIDEINKQMELAASLSGTSEDKDLYEGESLTSLEELIPNAEDTRFEDEDETTSENQEDIIVPIEDLNEKEFKDSKEENSATPSFQNSKREDIKDNHLAEKKEKAAAGTNSEESIRVRLSRIDKINNVIGELVILQTVVSQRRFQFVQDDITNKSIGMMNKLFKEAQELVMSLRMLPLRRTFHKMNRVVRDTSKFLNKDVTLTMVGEDTEVDKTVLEKISDPLVHIVRNAVDHGLELKEDRERAGKSAQGTVELMAYHEGSNLVLQITDDGKGIDPEIIRNKAIEKGIIKKGSIMSDQEVMQLIFHPGFSTKEQVSEVSGRGVGMDVVKTNIESLGGEVKVMSKLGEGSSFKIGLPLTLAIIEGIVIASKEEKFVIPLSQISEITQLNEKDIESFKGVASLFTLRGEVLPLFYINHKLGVEQKRQEKYTVIIIRGLNYACGIAVDDILNQQQIVIKKLGEDIRTKRGVMGSAIMSDGKPSLILDLFELFKEDLKKSRGYEKLKLNKKKKDMVA